MLKHSLARAFPLESRRAVADPPNTAAARMSEGLDFSAPDRVNDHVYNHILWFMLKGETPQPVAHNQSPLPALPESKSEAGVLLSTR